MEKQENYSDIAYKKAKKRVKEITNYYYFVGGYLFVAAILLYKNYDGNVFNFSKDYILIMLGLQGLFLIIYGLYLFVPALHNWEERKTKKLMEKYRKNGRQH